MRRHSRDGGITLTLFILLGAFAVLGAGKVQAGICTDSPDAFNRMSSGASFGAVNTISGGDFSLFAWLRPSNLSAAESAVFEVVGGLQLHVLTDGSVRATLLSGSNPPLVATAYAGIQPHKWTLIALSFSAQTSQLSVWAISESQPLSHSASQSKGFAVGPVGSNVIIGSFGNVPAMLGKYGAITIRKHAVTEFDVLDVWNSRLHLAGYSTNNLGQGGSMTGPDDCIYMINHAMTTSPINHAFGVPPEPAAVVGQPSTRRNYHVFDRHAAGSSNSLRVVRLLGAADGFTYCSPYDPPGDGFFVRPLPTLSEPLPEPHYVPGDAPLLRQLATGPQGLLRVMTSANSRAVLAWDGSEHGTTNYAHGFIMLNPDKTAGVINRPARMNNFEPWFGFDAYDNAPHTAGEVTEIRFHNFARFWTGSYTSSGTGPGEGVHLAPGNAPQQPGATYIMRCRPQGMIEPDQPLVMRAHLLRYPGASDVAWAPNLHSQQGESGADTAAEILVSLDTTQWTHVLSARAGDSVPASSQIILACDHTSKLTINDAVQTGPCISLVQSFSYNPTTDKTTINLQRSFTVPPQMGDTLRFGSWGFHAIEYEWPGVDPLSDDVWRGLRLTTIGNGHGAILFSFSAWRPDVNGYVFGTAGWAGRGYAWQIQHSFAAATSKWMQHLEPDVWLQMFAQQQSVPSHMAEYMQFIRDAKPDIEIAWLGDYEHESGGPQEAWHRYILENAEQHDVIAVSALMDERVGSFIALLEDGLRSDANHISERGVVRLAEVWTEKLFLAAVDPNMKCAFADLNCDGVVDGFDLLLLLGAWGPCPVESSSNTTNSDDCGADLNNDGVVDGFDLLLLLASWG